MKLFFTIFLSGCIFFNNGLVNAQTTFTNNNPITIYSNSHGDPFPSTLVVSGLNNYTMKVVVTLENVSIVGMAGKQVYLESPTGQVVCLFSRSGSAFFITSGDLIFDQDSPNVPPYTFTGNFLPGTYRPSIASTQDLPAGTTDRLDSFNNYNPNGTWKLYASSIVNNETEVSSIPSWSLTIIASDTPLPLSLTKFEAHKQGRQAVLRWETSAETNTDVFEIERSTDGKEFKIIDQVKAAGNSTVTRQYTYIDQVPMAGNNYYRLKMKDQDGDFTYSMARAVEFSLENIKIYPNPFKRKLFIARSGQFDTAGTPIKIINAAGVEVMSHDLTKQGVEEVNVSNLPAGLYFALIGGRTIRLVKE
ncbi:T9SS type A sorting domain-containing protein [Pedobacter sp. BS3]|uniref:T9SS type A sorting domain-containing protein n=1 Tax=Pedobacter sp. BS3 TaxID=2567937 RepID=UPI0011F008FD|nr:T9SS type A sorting domain-containing protein [Pedobacter sp. BS3]TZF83261.1 T9SS type A sorting domain-containing protein [Pedobacter sp. BS3]